MRKRRAARVSQYTGAGYKELQRRVAANVRRIREEHGWTQEEAAHRCEMSTQLFQRLEGEGNNTTLTTLGRVCDGFSVDPSMLLRRVKALKRRPAGRPKEKAAATEKTHLKGE